MANIVVSFYNPLRRDNGIYPYIETFINGLVEHGNQVLCFEKLAPDLNIASKMPQNYLQEIKAFEPDLFIFFNNQFWDISNEFDAPIVIYDIDSPNVYANINIFKNSDRYKYFCITEDASSLIKEAVKCRDENICYIPPFSGVISESLEKEREIAFCGSHWLWNDFDEIFSFIHKNPNKKERMFAKKVFELYKEYPCLYPEEIYEKFNFDSDLKFNTKNLYIFSTRVSGVKRLRALLELTDFDLEIRGQHWNNQNCHILKGYPELLLCYSSEIVNNTMTTQNFYNSSKIGFNTTHIQAKNGFGFRVADILASSSCLVTEYSSDLFKLGFDIPTYKTPSEAKSLCEEILKNENYRTDIVDKCNAIINKKHRFKNILPIMEQFLNMKLTSNDNGSFKMINVELINKKKNFIAKLFKF